MEKDIELYKEWATTRSPMALEKLLKQLDPLIQSEVNKRAGTLSRNLLESQAKVLTVKAIKGYNPHAGVKISTHVINQLQKLSRLNYAHQRAARVPEYTQLKFQTYNAANEDFKEAHGREPSSEELADTLNWSPKELNRYRDQMVRPELLESIDTPSDMFAPHQQDMHVDYAYYSMSPRQQKIFEHTVGYQNAPKLNNRQIMQKLNITQGVLSYEKNKIKAMLTRLQ